MKHWFKKLFATKSITPKRVTIKETLELIEKLKEEYQKIGMKCIDFKINNTSCKTDFMKDKQLWTEVRQMNYAEVWFVKC